MTWFVRADGQLESAFGSPTYLLDAYNDFWTRVQRGGRRGWMASASLPAGKIGGCGGHIITDPFEAQDELRRLWNKLEVAFRPTTFRNGEGWHLPETYAMVEQLGFSCDSTAIPGRRGACGHPMNWEGAPNQPYFPASADLCQPGPARSMVELPMNTWQLQASYDNAPRVRYMNPAVQPHLFARALKSWETTLRALPTELCVWVMIFHPDEVLASRGPDALYSRSIKELCSNLLAIVESLQRVGHDFEWATVSHAADLWRTHSAPANCLGKKSL